MSIATVMSMMPTVTGGVPITIETDITRGLHSFTIVGLAGKAIEESKDRISSAIKQSDFPSPKSQNHKITVSLAPADLKKEGPLFDVPLALAYLIASESIVARGMERRIVVGELGLGGTIRGIRGVLNIVSAAAKAGFKEVIVPIENAHEAACVPGITVYGATTLSAVVNHCRADTDHAPLTPTPQTTLSNDWQDSAVLLEDIKGQAAAKRALLIAAAGRHNLLLVGPPGTGKTLLARAFQGLLPPLSTEEALAVGMIRSLAGETSDLLTTKPPFRSPHHTASHTALVGGGTHPRPGEVTLAHHGVLFMDEFPEFDRRSIDALRQPLEDRVVTISRVQGTQVFPADIVLIAALNPYRGSEDGTTDLARAMHETYRGKISGPILDRIDLWVEVTHIGTSVMADTTRDDGETRRARETIATARLRQHERLKSRGVTTNSRLTGRDIDALITLTSEAQTILARAAEKLNVSPRGYHRIIKVAQTIADLDGAVVIDVPHVLEALQYRVKL